MAPTGYLGTPLAKKLGIKSGFKQMLVNAPEYYFDLFSDMPPDVAAKIADSAKWYDMDIVAKKGIQNNYGYYRGCYP